MKFLVVGTGSIGTRYARLASARVETRLYDKDCRHAAQQAKTLGLLAYTRLEDGLEWGPDAVIVATPHASHVDVSSAAINSGAHVLVEKPISNDLPSAQRLVDEARHHGRFLYVVCNMRFHPALQAVKGALCAIGRPIFARAHYGNYLPQMRPNSEYRAHYSASREDGGVIFDVIHEFDYLSWLFGQPQAVRWDRGQLGELEIDAEDYAVIGLRHSTGVRSEVHMDYLQRCKRRGLDVVGSEGTILWASEGKSPERCSVRAFRSVTDTWHTLLDSDDIDPNQPYANMMDQFVAALHGADTDLQTGDEACASLTVALTARNHASDRGHMDLAL